MMMMMMMMMRTTMIAVTMFPLLNIIWYDYCYMSLLSVTV